MLTRVDAKLVKQIAEMMVNHIDKARELYYLNKLEYLNRKKDWLESFLCLFWNIRNLTPEEKEREARESADNYCQHQRDKCIQFIGMCDISAEVEVSDEDMDMLGISNFSDYNK